MRRPRAFKRRAWLAFSGAGLLLAIVVGTFGWYDFGAPGTTGNLVTVSILSLLSCAAIFLACMGGMELFEAARFGRLARGEGVIARWHLDAESWRQRLLERRALDYAQPDKGRSSHVMSGDPPAAGVDIVISEDAVFVGPEAMYPLFKEYSNQAWVRDGWLEMVSRADDDGSVLRLPVPPGAEDAAEQVVKYFRLLEE